MRFTDYHKLTHVAAGVHVGLVSFDPANFNHLKLFRSKGGALYQRLAQRHGAEFNLENIENIIKAAAQSDAILRFVVVAKRLCKPVIAGIMTSVQTYDVKWDQDGNRYVLPLEHGEDLVLNERIAKWFRKATKSKANPKGESLGSAVVKEQIHQAVNDPVFKNGGKDNEHSLTNEAIKGVMVNNGAKIGTEIDSLVFQIRPDQVDLGSRIGVKVDIEYPHGKDNYFARDENSFIAHWVSEDRKQQISIVFTKIPATSDPEPVVWTRVTSNGNQPDEKTLNLVLLSMLKAGMNEIESPGRLWMTPTGHEESRDFYKAFGGVSPTFHLHTHKNQWLVEALKKIGEPRYYGDALMIAGQIDYSDATAKSGAEPFNPTIVQCTGEDPANDPIFDFELSGSNTIVQNYSPSRTNARLSNDNAALKIA